MQIR
ncbi:uncharacterized protein FFFS_16033 [Fusarium fujikuroi]|jgi:transposase